MPSPTNHTDRILVVVPAYNEGSTLYSVVHAVQELGYSVLVVDDGSAVPALHQLRGLSVQLLRHRVNLGQGAALQTAFAYAQKLDVELLVTFDADGQHQPADIETLISPLLAGQADVTLGSRFLPESRSGVPWKRKLVLQLARLVNFVLSGYWLSDAHNGLRAMNRKAYSCIRLTENRMAHASELLFEIRKNKLRFTEVPVHIRYPANARKKGQSAWQGIRILFDLVLHKLFK